MKHNLFILAAMLLTFCVQAQAPNFSFTIKVDGLGQGSYPLKAKLMNSIKGDTLIYTDTLTAINNTVTVKGYVKEETLITFSVFRSGMFDCAIGPGDSAFLRVTDKKFGGDFDIHGSPRPVTMANYMNLHFKPQSRAINQQKELLDSLALHNGSYAEIVAAEKTYQALSDSFYQYNIAFADTSCSANAVYYALFRYLGEDRISDHVTKAVSRFGNTISINVLVKDHSLRLNTPSALSKGDTLHYLDLFKPKERKAIAALFDKSKLILIDFWASWCGPCIEEFPFLSSAWQQFNTTGFDIISLSIDKDAAAWQKAMEKINNPWKNNYRDEKAWDSPTIKHLQIKSIPRNYLIDRNGKVYAKDLRGTEIFEVLKRLL